MIKEYIEREAAIETFEQAFDNNWEVSGTLDRIRAIPASDVVERPGGISLERLQEIFQAEAEGRLFIKAKPREETCGSCIHFKRTTGNASGVCDTRRKKSRYGYDRGVLYVTQSRRRCRDDYERRDGGREE